MSIGKRKLMTLIGYEFKDELLLEKALSHRSVGSDNNERLEFLGDSLLNFFIAERLFEKFPECREGQLSQMRAQLVKGVTLAEIAREFGLGEHLNLGPGEMKSGGHRRESILADVVEALIGAIYSEAGMNVCRQRVLSWYDDRLNSISPTVSQKDPKSQLQELLQSRKKGLPIYHQVEVKGDDHNQVFVIACEISVSKKRFIGESSNRRGAEQECAQQALIEVQRLFAK